MSAPHIIRATTVDKRQNARIVNGSIIVPAYIDDFVVIATKKSTLLPQDGDAFDETKKTRVFSYHVENHVIVFQRTGHSGNTKDTLYLPAIDVPGKRDIFSQFRIAGPYDDVGAYSRAFNTR